ncbi:MAG: hypothetical protein AAF467_28140 [Actinomycetota bacterium]
MSDSLAIVIAAHDRPESLARLLTSLARVEGVGTVPVVVSIDGGGARHRAVVAAATEFAQRHRGPATVVEHDHLGLVAHFHACGDLTARYGAVLFLEDDLIVGPGALVWAQSALRHGRDDARIAGVGLAAPWFDGYRHHPFEPLPDGTDAFYLQVPWYHGMAWTADMWERYRTSAQVDGVAIHPAFDALDADEWFPAAMRYLVATGRTYLFPRTPQASNQGDAGTHFATTSNRFQVAIDVATRHGWSIPALDEAVAYDDHQELTTATLARLQPDLAAVQPIVDLRGVRSPASVAGRTLLTTRPVRRADQRWGLRLRPAEANVIHGIDGSGIALAEASDVFDSRWATWAARGAVSHHAARGHRPGMRSLVRQRVDLAALRWFDGRR